MTTEQRPVRILVLPGIGDIYWVAVALESFIARHELGKPEVWIWDIDGRRRSLEYVQRIPFVTAGGYWAHTHKGQVFREAYMEDGRSVYTDFCGFDYFIAVNGALRNGRSVEQAMPGDDINWYFETRRNPLEDLAASAAQREWGDFILGFLSEHGMFEHWLRAWGVDGCVAFVRRLQEQTEMPILLTGCSWDGGLAERVASKAPEVYNLVGQTTLDDLLGLMAASRGMAGWCGGNTILNTYLRKPTAMGWSRYFKDERFFINACPPDSLGFWYWPFVVERDRPEYVAEGFASVVANERAKALRP